MRPPPNELSIEHGRYLGTTNVDALAEGLGLPREELDAKIEGLFDRLGLIEQARPLLAELAGYCEAALCRLSAAVEPEPETNPNRDDDPADPPSQPEDGCPPATTEEADFRSRVGAYYVEHGVLPDWARGSSGALPRRAALQLVSFQRETCGAALRARPALALVR